MTKLPKAYEPNRYENGIYQKWEESGFFNPDECVKAGVTEEDADYFSMMLPPPNVTGTLHMGHAVMLATQDLLVRYHRMKGEKSLWLPGTDHAAVATESKVEKKLIQEEDYTRPKDELGRERFMQKLEEFVEESKSTIINQAKKMGSSLDWSRYAFTLDKQRNKAVKTVFKNMYEDGLIYRDYRTVNWSTKGQSTCSDDELEHETRQAKLYTFVYSDHWKDLETGEEYKGEDFPITIATTRPETKLGDTAIAVDPDGKWSQYIGKEYEVYDVGQEGHTLRIKVIASEEVEEEFGTGAVGVTPAHSHVDYDIYRQQKQKEDPIDLIQIIKEDGTLNTKAGSQYQGLSVEEAREKFVDYLTEKELLKEEVEEVEQNVGKSDRFGDVVEVLPKLQWFVDVNKEFTIENSNIKGIDDGEEVTLKQIMQYVVEEDLIEILPDRFEKNYFHWINNLRDWCISRQIWYGHRIPVWYCQNKNKQNCKDPIVETQEIDACPHCGGEIKQDPDTLDTWFSSGLWTFSTLGWPDNKKGEEFEDKDYFDKNDLERFHPTTLLETGYDILFFWVARMILMTTYNLGEIPFETVYLHGLVLDENGSKMSKSKGNVIDPLKMKKKYGADATRMSLLVGNTPGNDMSLSEEKIESMKHFSNKLWNISRYILMNIEKPRKQIQRPEPETISDQWILQRLSELTAKTTKRLENYRFSEAGEKLRDFTWGELADWYLEIAKIEEQKDEMLNYILNTILKLWHPFIPFVTETVWQKTYQQDHLMVADWPKVDYEIEKRDVFEFYIKDTIVNIRRKRNDYRVDPNEKVKASVVADDIGVLDKNKEIIKELANLSELHLATEESEVDSEKKLKIAQNQMTIYLDIFESVDVNKEIKETKDEIEDKKSYTTQLNSKLSNEEFLNKAPQEVVEAEKEKYKRAKQQLEQLQQKLNSLKEL